MPHLWLEEKRETGERLSAAEILLRAKSPTTLVVLEASLLISRHSQYIYIYILVVSVCATHLDRNHPSLLCVRVEVESVLQSSPINDLGRPMSSL